MECRSRSAAVRPARPAPAPAVRARATRCADVRLAGRSPGSWMVPGARPRSRASRRGACLPPGCGAADATAICFVPSRRGIRAGPRERRSAHDVSATRAPRRICSAAPTPEHGAGDGFRLGRSVWNTASGTPAPAPGAHRAAPPWRRGTGSPGCRDLPAPHLPPVAETRKCVSDPRTHRGASWIRRNRTARRSREASSAPR